MLQDKDNGSSIKDNHKITTLYPSLLLFTFVHNGHLTLRNFSCVALPIEL